MRREVQSTDFSEFRIVSPSQIKPGKVVEAYYLGIVKTTNSQFHKFSKKDGEEFGIWGSAVLNRKLSFVPGGCYVWISCLGKKKGGNGFYYYDFNVEYDDEDIFNLQKSKKEVDDDIPF